MNKALKLSFLASALGHLIAITIPIGTFNADPQESIQPATDSVEITLESPIIQETKPKKVEKNKKINKRVVKKVVKPKLQPTKQIEKVEDIVTNKPVSKASKKGALIKIAPPKLVFARMPKYRYRSHQLKGKKAIFQMTILENGKVEKFVLIKSSGHEPFDEFISQSLKKNYQKWKFEPKKVGGQPVKSTVEVPFVIGA